ncbi:reverse transcriptase [Gossypium australe]|uniref:Reverse transcriptase n=1 Tax=Gossypium australe TaxID=47621 RepID=A0A5B6X175_9ROSI|nr:reverse transcriptase [Gossypium australe]
MNVSLLKQFTKDDISYAVKTMTPLKAPWVDGFPVICFQRYWHIVGPDISRYCLAILNGHLEVGEINKTRIILIPKVEKPKNMSQFKPISLCNVVYKIIAKVLVNRMSNILGDCINEVKGAFIPGRLISDNVLITYEVLHSLKMKKRGKKGNFALKLDMSKAYDRVEWDFLAGMMKHLGFHDDWIVFIIRCVYDCILFGDASCEGARVVCDVIQEYEMISGQRVNYDKSLIYFGANVGGEVKEDITRLLEVRVASSPEKYLGLPMMVGRRKTWALASFVGRFRKHVEGWSLRYLSMGGKEVFIKSVLQATPIYAMQSFLFPKCLCRKLESIMNSFWWFNNKTLKGIHWSCWEKLCKPKCKGGLGFKDLVLFNKVLLAKQVWRILSQPHCLLARVLKARYFPFSDILSAKVGSYPSLTWRSICSARELIEERVLWRVGKGDQINIWNDPWLPGRENNRVAVQDISPMWTSVNQLTETADSNWNRDLINCLFDETTANRILAIPISRGRSEDTLVWKHEGSGDYTVKSGYRVLNTNRLLTSTDRGSNDDEYKDFYNDLWSLNILERIKIHNWRMFNDMLPHFSNLARRTLTVEATYPVCKTDREDSDHVLWSCGVLQRVWSSLQVKVPSFEDSLCCKQRFARTFSAANEQQKRIIAISSWFIWFRRNKLVHEGVKFSMQEMIGFIRGYNHELDLCQENFRNKVMTKDLWRPPDYGFIKLNVDSSFQKNVRLAKIAVVARDSMGEIIGAESYLFENVADPFVAEARACERALLRQK